MQNTTEETITGYANDIGIPRDLQYFIKPEFQDSEISKGQPNVTIYDKLHRKLYIGTCYEEYPYFIDKFYEYKKELKDTNDLYFKSYETIAETMSKIDSDKDIILDSNKNYYVFYHYAMYAESMDRKKIPPMIKKYNDSVQFFFVNIDKVMKIEGVPKN